MLSLTTASLAILTLATSSFALPTSPPLSRREIDPSSNFNLVYYPSANLTGPVTGQLPPTTQSLQLSSTTATDNYVLAYANETSVQTTPLTLQNGALVVTIPERGAHGGSFNVTSEDVECGHALSFSSTGSGTGLSFAQDTNALQAGGDAGRWAVCELGVADGGNVLVYDGSGEGCTAVYVVGLNDQ